MHELFCLIYFANHDNTAYSVAVCGVPEACSDHAEVMANFARQCLYQFNKVRTNNTHVRFDVVTC